MTLYDRDELKARLVLIDGIGEARADEIILTLDGYFADNPVGENTAALVATLDEATEKLNDTGRNAGFRISFADERIQHVRDELTSWIGTAQ